MFFDLVALISLSLAHFQIAFASTILTFSSVYLILKGVIFRDVMSMIDLVSGIYILIVLLFGISSFMYYLVFGWFAYKFVFTLTS